MCGFDTKPTNQPTTAMCINTETLTVTLLPFPPSLTILLLIVRLTGPYRPTSNSDLCIVHSPGRRNLGV